MASIASLPAAHAATENSRTAATAGAAHSSQALWRDVKGEPAAVSSSGAKSVVRATRFRTVTLDGLSMAGMAANAPLERTQAARQNPLVIALPDPSGGYQRFSIAESPIMEPGLAAKHPDIKTFAGRGIDDPTATLRVSITPLGFNASVRSQQGGWYIDPVYQRDTSLYASYYRRDVPKPRTSFAEGLLNEAQISLSRGRYHAADKVQVGGIGFAPGAQVTITVRNADTDANVRQTLFATASRDGTVSMALVADPYRNLGSYVVTATDGLTTATASYQVVGDKASLDASVGPQLRTYRLALLTDPGYAAYHGAANVTAAKVTLMNRVTQVYEDETSIRLVLIANNDVLNLDTAAQFSQPNGPCGAAACYATAAVSCTSATLTRTRFVIGLLAGPGNYDIGHIAVGAGGGGVASLGVVGRAGKAQGCTGLPTPVGDLFAVDYVAHEMGHQFAGNHTFNGIAGSCTGGNRNAPNSVEPGSGSSIMAYAGICTGADDLQAHSDPYWSQRSFDEITTHVTTAESLISEVQTTLMAGFTTNGQQFQLRYNGADSAPVVRGTNFTTALVKAAIEAIPGWPAGGTVNVTALTDTGFTVTFGGTLANQDTALVQLVNCTGGCGGVSAEVDKGGATTRGGTATATGNSAPVVSVPATMTIPVLTPFALTGSATDANGDVMTYMWEQNDRGAATGTSMTSNTKTNGPLFRQFGTIAVVTAAGTVLYNSPGENATTTNPTRVFPDMEQILANNTNAETGTCPVAAATPTADQINCFSEFLPTAAYVGFTGVNLEPSLNFKFTARDGKGGVNSGTTKLLLAATAGPFLVTSPNTAVTLTGGSTQAIAWSVANTNLPPVGATDVKITLSTDGGLSFPVVLAASTPNSGSANVTLPNVATTKARIKIEALGNVFFDVSNADFTITAALVPGDVDGDGAVNCVDLAIVKAALGKSTGQAGFDIRADVVTDGTINIRDLSFVAKRVPAGTVCP